MGSWHRTEPGRKIELARDQLLVGSR
uniref:Uncharacterized protein n=1 Tax=Arundo donax TaxID=35708 RepID=A0A0A9HV61_ARUDO